MKFCRSRITQLKKVLQLTANYEYSISMEELTIGVTHMFNFDPKTRK